MRTITAAEDALLTSIGGRSVFWRAKVKDSGGTFRDLSTYPGRNLCVEATWKEDVDSNGMDADITLKRESEKISIAPLVAASPLNLGFAFPGTYAKLIELAREVQIEVAVKADGVAPAAGDWVLQFHGYIDELDPAQGEHLLLRCSGLEAKLRDTFIERERAYAMAQGANATKGCFIWRAADTIAVGDRLVPNDATKNGHFYRCTSITTGITGALEPTWPTGAGSTVVDGGVTWTESGSTSLTAGTALETLIQQIVDDNLGAGFFTLVTPVSPGWQLKAWKQDRVSVWDAIRALVDQIGWDLRFRWDSGSSSFKLTLSQPDRAKVTPDRTFTAGQRYKLTRLQSQVSFLRNVVRVWYNDSADKDAQSIPKRKSYVESDAASITAYSRRYCEISEEKTSNIDSTSEATTMAHNILLDLSTPYAEQECELPLFRFAELGDLYRWKADALHYDSDQDFAVIGLRHHVSGGDSPQARSAFVCRGKPSAGVRRWLTVANRGQHNADLQNSDGLTITTSDVVGGTKFLIKGNEAKDALPPEYEAHVSATQGFTPDSTTLVRRGALADLVVPDLIPGKQYYSRVIPYGHNRSRIIKAQPSAEIGFVGGRASAGHINGGIALGAYPLNGGFETRLDTAAMPDHWTLRSGTLGTQVVVMEDGNGMSGGRYIRLASSSSGSIQSAKFPIIQEAMEANRSGGLYRFRWWRKAGSSNSAGATYDTLVRLLDSAGGEVLVLTPFAGWACDNKTTHWVQEEAYLKVSPGNSTARDAQLIIQGRAGATFQLDIDEYRAEYIGTPWYEVGNTTGFTDNYEAIPGFANSWVNYDATNEAKAAFRKDQFGEITLKGVTKSGTIGSVPMFTLPVGWRPPKPIRFATTSNVAFGHLEIRANGEVWPVAGSNVWFSLEGIHFMTTETA